jgi:hypothetical protein
MGEEFYSVIKLISGEEIFALVSIDKDDRILTMSESKDAKLIAIYDNFIEDEQDETMIDVYQPNGEVQITNTMGYISSVEDARKKFEEIFKINQKPKEN